MVALRQVFRFALRLLLSFCLLSLKEKPMFSSLTSRRSFAIRLTSLFSGVGAACLLSNSKVAAAQAPSGVQKLDYEGKTAGTGFITPLIIHNGVIYIAGQGAHSHDPDGKFATDIETHTQKVMENVK